MNVSRPGFERCPLRSGKQHQTSSTTLGNHLALHRPDVDAASASPHRQIATHVSYVDLITAGFSAYGTANVIHVDSAAAAFSFQATGNSRGHNSTALSFDLHQVDITRHCHCHVGGEFMRMPRLPLADN